MAKRMTTKEKLIESELQKYQEMFKDIDENKKTFADKLCQQCAFMIATLQELNEHINKFGAVETIESTNGKSTLTDVYTKTYNATIKSFNATIKQLTDLVPDSKKKEVKETTQGIPPAPMTK